MCSRHPEYGAGFDITDATSDYFQETLRRAPEVVGPKYDRRCSICACSWMLDVLENQPKQEWCDDDGCRCHREAFAKGWWMSRRGEA